MLHEQVFLLQLTSKAGWMVVLAVQRAAHTVMDECLCAALECALLYDALRCARGQAYIFASKRVTRLGLAWLGLLYPRRGGPQSGNAPKWKKERRES